MPKSDSNESTTSERKDDVEYAPSIPTIAGLVPVTAIMTRDVLCVRGDRHADEVLDLMIDNSVGCLPVVDEDGCPIGMITKRDLVEPFASRVQPRRASPDGPATAAMIMLPIALSVGEHATVLQAAALMTRQGMHHVPVVSPKGRIVGIVSSLDIVAWLVRNDGVAEEASTRSPA